MRRCVINLRLEDEEIRIIHFNCACTVVCQQGNRINDPRFSERPQGPFPKDRVLKSTLFVVCRKGKHVAEARFAADIPLPSRVGKNITIFENW